jgi:LysM domain
MKVIKAIILWVLIGGGVFALLGYLADRAQAFSCDPEPHSVEYGDTLWAIAEAKCEGNLETVTDNLVAVYGSNIQVGWTIWLPTDQDCLLENRDGQIYDECG